MKQITIQMRRRTPAQKRISESTARFNVALWGRQSGKTTYGLDKMIYKPLSGRRGGIYWNVLQTYSAAEVAFDRYDRLLFRSDLLRKKPNISDLCFFLQNDVNVFFKSGDKPNNLRAETLDGAIIDECREQKKEIWSQIILPMLGRRKGWCDFLSTSNGYDWFYDLYEMARTQNPNGEWATFHAPSTEAWWWTEKEIAQARANMSEAEFAQEILAEFRDLSQGKAYMNYGTHNELRHAPWNKDEIYSPHLPFLIGLDFNLSPMAWSIGQKRGDLTYWFDEVWLKKSHTQEASAELVAKIKSYSAHRSNAPKVRLAGDATGKAGQRAAAGQSDYIILCQALDAAGIIWENITPDSNPQVRDRVNIVNAACKSADGSVKLFVHPERCPRLKKDLERVSWKQGASFTLDQSTNPELTHSSDGVGYALCATDNSMIAGSAGRVIVIRR